MKSALIIIDIQNDYFKGGRNELYRPDEAALQAKKALAYFRMRGMPVYHIQHISTRPGSSFFLPDTIGAEIYSDVAPLAGDQVITKHYPNAFYETGLAEELARESVTDLVVCGMMSQMCIDTTVRAAKDYGFSVTLLEDACAAKALSWNQEHIPAETVHNTIMASLNGMFAHVVKTDDFISDI